MFGNVGCRLWLTADVWLSTASIYNLLAISFDRYMAVRQPIRYPSISSKRVTRLLVALVWVFSGLLALCLFVLETLANTEKQECTPMKLPSLYIIFSASASFIVPAAIMVTEKLSLHSSEHSRKATRKASPITETPSEKGYDRSRARFMLRTELRVARTTAVVVGVFVICWFPFSTIYVLQAYSLCLMPDCITNTMYVIAFWLGYANSAVNPLIYAAFSRDFRAAFHKLVVRRKKGSFQKSIYKGKPF
ncbi:unnamed protein product [Haemonchus placei]|uniref:G-protein coupled receptors family 1 profile domain-containing protein n=1 Tax=Haemonchus placei TaxID=6290 RepID=A0A3P7UFA9_HAEPC|nr:unnamed protein product [Haemonchus placei]